MDQCYYCNAKIESNDGATEGIEVKRHGEPIIMCHNCGQDYAFYCGFGHHSAHIMHEYKDQEICKSCHEKSKAKEWTVATIAGEWPHVWAIAEGRACTVPIVAITDGGESIRIEYKGLVGDVPTGRVILALNSGNKEWAVKPVWRSRYAMETDIKGVYSDAFMRPSLSCPHCHAEMEHWNTTRHGGYIKTTMHVSGSVRKDGVVDTIDLESSTEEYDGDWNEDHHCAECGGDITEHICNIESAIAEAE